VSHPSLRILVECQAANPCGAITKKLLQERVAPLPGTIIIMARANDDDSFFAQERDRLASEIISVRHRQPFNPFILLVFRI